MSPSVFRPIRTATFAFLGLVVLALVASALLTIHEGRKLAQAQQLFGQISEFHRVHLIVTRRLVRLGQGEAEDARDVGRQMEQLGSLAVNADTPSQLGELRRAVEQPGTREVVYESIVAFQEIAIHERDTQAELLHQLQRDTLAHLQMEIAIPLAILAAGLILYPVARRRILQPLDQFGHQLTRIGEGDFSPAPDSEIDPLLLPLHQRFNQLVGRLRELEDAHERRARTLEDEVRMATRALLEQQHGLARAARLAATGELAASLAHELRNPLAAIQMSLHNLRAEIPDPKVVERIERIEQEVDRLTRLLNRLLDSARHVPEAPREVNLAALVGDLLDLTRHQLPPAIRLEKRVPADLVGRLPQDQLRQALLNLVLNAAAALPGEGTITVEAAREGQEIRLEVCDDGPGFPPEVLESGDRPFFSTRQQGTGLGLAVTRRFTRDLGGEMTLRNRSPHGACVTLLLPCRAEHG